MSTQAWFACKSLEWVHGEMQDDNRLHRVLGPVSLSALGVGANIGAGIFVMTGRAAALDAWPAIVVSYLVAALGVCARRALLCRIRVDRAGDGERGGCRDYRPGTVPEDRLGSGRRRFVQAVERAAWKRPAAGFGTSRRRAATRIGAALEIQP